MIDCYTWMTDNGYKPRMMLEETGLAHKIVPVNLREKAQMAPDFIKISPGHKIPAIVDHDGPGGSTVTLCESGAILKYLAEKTGLFYPAAALDRAKVDQWLFYGSATFTTLSQQFGHWTIRSPVKAPTAQQFYDAAARHARHSRPPACCERLHRRRLFHRRHDHVFRCAPARRQRHRAIGLSQREALARRHCGASGGAARLGAVPGVKRLWCCFFST